jgi:hypothetical protein
MAKATTLPKRVTALPTSLFASVKATFESHLTAANDWLVRQSFICDQPSTVAPLPLHKKGVPTVGLVKSSPPKPPVGRQAIRNPR